MNVEETNIPKTVDEFNKKYEMWLEEGFIGLEFGNGDPELIKFLDSVFETLVQFEDFKYSQIKLKFGYPRVYIKLDKSLLHVDRAMSEYMENWIRVHLKN